MNPLRQVLAISAIAILPLGLTAQNKASATETKSAKGSAKATSPKSPATKKGASTTAKRSTPYRAPYRPRQLQPTPERYKEIQQALASKGYLTGEPSGMWNQESVDALRRFQQDQNISPSGKIDSLS